MKNSLTKLALALRKNLSKYCSTCLFQKVSSNCNCCTREIIDFQFVQKEINDYFDISKFKKTPKRFIFSKFFSNQTDGVKK